MRFIRVNLQCYQNDFDQTFLFTISKIFEEIFRPFQVYFFGTIPIVELRLA